MDEVKIRVLKNGPYEVKGSVAITDQKRNPYKTEEDTVYLCRCGLSANKPFCDGAHTSSGFKAEETVQ